ncbi:nicotinate-nucleotide adenylyltransferase [Polystyrenella longa]|uniref:Nicotinate-nucleotide adenylyltransferase n=1 Tax=Polystyrenella longa TaxID=2528007 RepID=A0A518CHF6_9PLAN|nr:hypothetical protein [Polystyrenella longa]QDU78650.1 nicotinate-nucleotide adenylyltransferase [Polystyrenella longa]
MTPLTFSPRIRWVLLANSPSAELRSLLVESTSPDLISIDGDGHQSLARAMEQFHAVLEPGCLLRMIVPRSLQLAGRDGEAYQLLLLEQSVCRTACWVWESVTADELRQLVHWFHQPEEQPPRAADELYEQVATAELQQLWLGERTRTWVQQSQSLSDEPRPVGLLSGSFNPLHTGHRELKSLAEKRLRGPVHYEMPIRNADKPPLDYLSLFRRLRQFADEPVLLSTAATFQEKSVEMTEVTFIIGADTAIRVVNPRFYGSESDMLFAFEQLRERGCQFLVAPRQIGGTLLEERNVELPTAAKSLFEFIPVAEFCLDISSTELRGSQLHPFGLD